MAQSFRLIVFLLWYLIVSISGDSNDDQFKDVTQFILDSFNGRQNSEYVYNSAKVINAFKKNGSEPLYFMQLDISTSCKSSSRCDQLQQICELVIKEKEVSVGITKEILDDKTRCAKKETEPILPSFGHGFTEGNVSDEVRNIAAFAVQQSENGNIKRSVIDIMSVKKQTVGNGTTLFLTLKVTKTDGSDAMQFELCEAEVNQTGEMALESNLTCFSLNGMLPDAPLSADDVTAVAERAADELDSLSYSEFTLKLLNVLKADSAVTPGSEGVVTSLELRLAPTLCLKNVETDSDTDGLYEKRQCPENTSNKRLICSVVSWDRPWLDDTLYSEPSCHVEIQNEVASQDDNTKNVVRQVQDDNASAMMNDQMEPVHEESSFPAVEHHSIPVIEELDPIVEQIVPDTKESRVPVVEEPVVAKHVYCTGCPIDLDVNIPGLQEYVDQAIAMIDEASNGKYMHKATRIAKAQKQVTNGVKYILHLEVAETSCEKNSGRDRDSCEPNILNTKTCVVEFLEKPWLDSSREIVSNNCTNYNNDLENEIEPHFVFGSEAKRQEIFDYLDAMEEPGPVNERETTSYGRDGLYPPDSEPENHPVESDAEKIDVDKKPEQDDKDLDEMPTTATPVDSEESEELEKIREVTQKLRDNPDVSEESSEEIETRQKLRDNPDVSEESSEEIKESFDRAAAYVTGEDRERRESASDSGYGNLKEIDDSEKELVDRLSKIAVQTLDDVDEDDKKRIVLEVLGAQKQIVNGILYHLQLRVGSTSCIEAGPVEPSCMNEIILPVKVCKMQLHRSFSLNNQFDAKVVKSECSSEGTSEHESASRPKRSVGIITGGISPSNTSDPYITSVADYAVTELDKGTNSLYKQCIVRIVSASQQVVSGKNVYLTLEVADSIHRKDEIITGTCQLSDNAEHRICHVTIWDRPWLENGQQITASNCSSPEFRKKRDTAKGAPSDADVNDPHVLQMADFALLDIEKCSNALYRQKIVRVVEAKKQVVAGTLTHLTLEIGYTTCRKGSDVQSDTCQLKKDSNTQICHVKVWDRPWLNTTEVTHVNCSAASASQSSDSASGSRSKRDTAPGASWDTDVSDPHVLQMADFALDEIENRSNALYRLRIVSVREAKTQVVAGKLTNLTLEIGYTTCRKGSDAQSNTCQLKKDSNNQIYHVQVWDRPWLNTTEVTHVNCSAASASQSSDSASGSRSRREVYINRKKHGHGIFVGGASTVDPDDPYIQELANTALGEVDKQSNALYRQKIVKIIEARKQVVSGVLVHLTMELGYSSCRKGRNVEIESCSLKDDSNNQICFAKVWDRPWLNQREVKNISCNPASRHRYKKKAHIGGGNHDIHTGMFEDFIKKYNKSYPSHEEYRHRFHIFRANVKKIQLLQKTEQGTAKYGTTQFADLTVKEFRKYLGLNRKLRDTQNNIPMPQAKIPNVEIPKEFDWRHYNVVTEVKNQGQCGSCWAFSVTGNIEGQWALKKGKLYSLSEQELVDCDKFDQGCNGGDFDTAYKAIENLGGLETEKDYPYEGDDEKCHFKKSKVKVTIQGAVNITKNETQMAQWLYKNGPISIGINANAMQFYMGGISHPLKFLCSPEDLDHGVLIVGYGVHTYPIFQKVLPFWIIKNSWGESWGEQGYYRVYRGDGTCGVNQDATSSVIE